MLLDTIITVIVPYSQYNYIIIIYQEVTYS